MAKPVATKVFAAVPAGYHDKVILEVFAFEHAQDHHAGAAFAVVVFLGRAVDDSRPSVVGGFSEFLVLFEGFEGGVDVVAAGYRVAGDRVFGAAVGEDVLESLQWVSRRDGRPVRRSLAWL